MQRGIDSRESQQGGTFSRARAGLGWTNFGTWRYTNTTIFTVPRLPVWANHARVEWFWQPSTTTGQPCIRCSDSPDNYRAGGSDYHYTMLWHDSTSAGNIIDGASSVLVLSSQNAGQTWVSVSRITLSNLRSSGAVQYVFHTVELNGSGNTNESEGTVYRTWTGQVFGFQFFMSDSASMPFTSVNIAVSA